MSTDSIVEGIIIGAVGGAAAGLTVPFVQYLHEKVVVCREKKRVYEWLHKNTEDSVGKRHRSTRTIASYTNLTEDRVRYICSIHQAIYLSTGEKPDFWGIYGVGR
jgi:hypothetical protein